MDGQTDVKTHIDQRPTIGTKGFRDVLQFHLKNSWILPQNKQQTLTSSAFSIIHSIIIVALDAG